MKKRAVLLKREGKLTEAKEELKKAKILEKELEERAILGESDESDDDLAELIRGLDGRGKTNDDLDLNLDLNGPIELPPVGFNIEKLLSGGDLDQFGEFEVTNEDLHDPDLNSALKSFGWDDEEEKEVGKFDGAHSSVTTDKDDMRDESVKDHVYTLKKEAVIQKRAGNTSEAMALLKKAKLLEKSLLEVGFKETLPEIKERNSQPNAGANTNLNPSGSKPGLRNKLVIQRELLAVKKGALALRREGKIEESERELERGKHLEKELEEVDNRPKLPVNNMNPVMVNTNPLDLGDEMEETEVTDSDMRDPDLLSVLQNLGWDEKEDSGAAVAATVNFAKHPPRKSKLEMQRELLAVKKRALALTREGKIGESQRELESAKVLERELDDFNANQEPAIPIPLENPLGSLEKPVETQVTETDMRGLVLRTDLQNEMGSFSNKSATATQSRIGDEAAQMESKATEAEKPDPQVSSVLNSLPERKVRKKSKGEVQRELLALKRNALQLRRQGREEEAESELEKAKELEQQLAELETHNISASEQLIMSQPDMESSLNATSVAEKPIQVTQTEVPLLDQNSVKNEIVMHKRKALALKREGKISEAKEELRQAKLLEKNLEESSDTTVTAVPEVVPESKPVQTRKSISTRDRVKIQQESLSHKRNALKLRREGKIAESEAELEIAKSLEAQLDDSTGEDVSLSSDVAVEDFLDPQLMSALRSIGWGESDIGTVKPEPSRRAVERENNDERIKIEGEIKREKLKALNLKRAGKEKEALEVLRNAKLMEKKLASMN